MTPESPYKGLASFGDNELDSLLFFGRNRERETIVANVLASKLTVLYGSSGVGKSSLLRAGVAQALRAQEAGAVIVHDVWAGGAVEALVESVRAEAPGGGPTTGLPDTVAAAASAHGEVHLLLDQFEECFRYPDSDEVIRQLSELLRRPGTRVTVLIALRDDALAELDVFTSRIPETFANLLRLDALDRRAAREAIVAPLERFNELTGGTYDAERELVDALLDQVALGDRVETPFLQLVLERLWQAERESGSTTLRAQTLSELGGAERIVRDHVDGTLAAATPADQDIAARLLRQLVTPSGQTLSHQEGDLVTLADVSPEALRPVVAELERRRILRGVPSVGGAPRVELYHDVLAEPVLGWLQRFELERERRSARRQRRRLLLLVGAALTALVIVGALAAYAFGQAHRSHAHELDARALVELSSDPASSLRLALRAAALSPDSSAETALRAGLLAMREERVLRLGSPVVDASFSPLSGNLLVAAANGRVVVYGPTGQRLLALPRRGAVTHAVWSGDGREIAIGGEDGNVRVLSGDGRVLRTVRTPAPISSLGFVGRTLLIGSGGHVRIVYGTRGTVRTLAFPGAATAAALSPDKRWVAVAARRQGRVTTFLIDVRTRRVRVALPEHGIDAVAFGPDGRTLATGSTDKTARLWDVPNGRLRHVLVMRGHVVALRFSPRGRVLMTSSADGTVAVWDARRGTRDLLLVGATGGADDAALSPDGNSIAVGFSNGDARLYDASNGEQLAELAGHTDAVESVGFSPRGTTIVTGSADGTARLWSATAGDEFVPIDKRTQPTLASFASSSVIRSVAGGVAHLLTVDGRLLKSERATVPLGTHRSPGGRLVVAISGREADLRDARKGTLLHRLVGHESTINDAEFSNDGRYVVTASDDHTARIWNVRTGALVHVLRGHFFPVYAASFSPDGRWVVTASQLTAGLWNAQTGQLVQYLHGHARPLTSVSFSPDGRWIVSGGEDGMTGILRCDICAGLGGLERTARSRLSALG